MDLRIRRCGEPLPEGRNGTVCDGQIALEVDPGGGIEEAGVLQEIVHRRGSFVMVIGGQEAVPRR
jgi:hypothetical protein